MHDQESPQGQPPSGPSLSQIINKHTYMAIGAGLIPIPVADIAAVTGVQLAMLSQICKHYGVEFAADQGRSFIYSLVSSTGSSLVARLGASALKGIPALGTAVGMATMAVLSGASTYSIGHVFAKHFEQGGSMDDFNANNFAAYYKEKFEEGKSKAKEMKRRFDQRQPRSSAQEPGKVLAAQLKELQSMLDKGQIAMDEYERRRDELLRDFMGQ